MPPVDLLQVLISNMQDGMVKMGSDLFDDSSLLQVFGPCKAEDEGVLLREAFRLVLTSYEGGASVEMGSSRRGYFSDTMSSIGLDVEEAGLNKRNMKQHSIAPNVSDPNQLLLKTNTRQLH